VFASRDVLTGFGVTMSFHRVLLRRAFETLKNTGLGLAYGLCTTFPHHTMDLVTVSSRLSSTRTASAGPHPGRRRR